MKKFLLVSILFSSFLLATNGPVIYGATIEELQAQLQTLMQQLSTLQNQAADLSQKNDVFQRNLSYNLSNDKDVRALQMFLKDKGYFSGELTGNYYNITIQAVKNFQVVNGIESTGFVGPLTRVALNRQIGIMGGEQIINNNPAPAPTASISARHGQCDLAFAGECGDGHMTP